MIAKVYSAIPYGYDGHIVEVEGDSNRGLPAFNIVGMANKTISEAKERVRSAIANSDLCFPTRKVTINLAPAELAKDGTHLDLPIALAVLLLSGQLLEPDIVDRLFIGELSLSGQLRPVRGIINVVEAALDKGYHEVYVPYQNLRQASLIQGIKIIGVKNLRDLVLHLQGLKTICNDLNTIFPDPHNSSTQNPLVSVVQKTCTGVAASSEQNVVKNNCTDSQAETTSDVKITQTEENMNVVKNTTTDPEEDYTLDQIIGQPLAKRALAIAVAGHHNLLLYGPPGSGKTLLAKTACNLLPSPTKQEQIEMTKIHSLFGDPNQIINRKPFRAPHHTASASAILGGGPHVTPGEISLAHHGILFLDEIPEFHRNVLEALRQPLEDGTINISRANKHVVYPANFMLIATMNPCPCGYFGDPGHECQCSAAQIEKYHQKISGPILDRIDMILSVKNLPQSQLIATNITSLPNYTEHNVVKNNISEAIQRQFQRYKQETYNSDLSSTATQQHLTLDETTRNICLLAAEKLNLSARGYFKMLKVARTIADLENSNQITSAHIAEALSFRQNFTLN